MRRLTLISLGCALLFCFKSNAFADPMYGTDTPSPYQAESSIVLADSNHDPLGLGEIKKESNEAIQAIKNKPAEVKSDAAQKHQEMKSEIQNKPAEMKQEAQKKREAMADDVHQKKQEIQNKPAEMKRDVQSKQNAMADEAKETHGEMKSGAEGTLKEVQSIGDH